MKQSEQSAGRRLSIITIDQVVAGASNVLIAIAAARILGVGAFGLFGIVFIVYVTSQGISRALICEPLLVHPAEAEERPGEVIGTVGVLGLAAGLAVCLSGLLAHVWNDRLGDALLILGVCLPLLVLQDIGRYLGIVTHRPSFSLTLDLVWLALMIVALGIVIVAHAETLAWFVLAWAASGAVSGMLVLWTYRGHALRLSLSWLRETWGFSWRYLLSFTATQGSALVASIGIVVISGVRTLGAVRGALLLVSPIVTFQAASISAGVAEVSRLPTGGHGVGRHIRRTTALTVGVAGANLLVLVFLPDELGRFVLGATWEPTKPLLLPASIQMVLLALISGTRSTLLGLRAIRVTVKIDIASTVIALTATLVGVVLGGALGAYWALAVGQGLIVVIWWTVYLRHDHGRTGESATVTEREALAA